jgi:hypothetical protein
LDRFVGGQVREVVSAAKRNLLSDRRLRLGVIRPTPVPHEFECDWLGVAETEGTLIFFQISIDDLHDKHKSDSSNLKHTGYGF